MPQVVRSIHGADLAGFTLDNRLIARKGVMSGGLNQEIQHPSPDRVTFLDQFDGAAQAYSTTVASGWRSRKGSDGACVDWTVTPDTGGKILGTIGNTTASMAVSGIQLDRGLSWKANQGDLVLQARVKMSTVSNIAVFLGFTDQTAALEMPIQSAGGAHTITTNATDAVGLLYDTSDTSTDQWLAVGVANDVDATVQANLTGAALIPVADTYETFRIELSTTGVAKFFRNGVSIGSAMSGAVTATVALTPVIAAFNRTTSGAPTVSANYVHLSGLRV